MTMHSAQYTVMVAASLLIFAVISVVGAGLTVYDKIAAKKAPKHRVPEKVLVAFGVLGGAPVMYIVMQLIHHKTRKPKFAVGFPIIIVLQLAAIAALYIWAVRLG